MKYLIQNDCPDFVAPAVKSDGAFTNSFRLSDYFLGKCGIIFFFPFDFNYISVKSCFCWKSGGGKRVLGWLKFAWQNQRLVEGEALRAA
jgi:hypothetical protein